MGHVYEGLPSMLTASEIVPVAMVPIQDTCEETKQSNDEVTETNRDVELL